MKLDEKQRAAYAKAVDDLLDDECLRKTLIDRLKNRSLDFVEALGIDVNCIDKARLRELGLRDPGGGVEVGALPVVAVGVFVLSQIRDTPDSDDDDGTTGTGGDDGGTGGTGGE